MKIPGFELTIPNSWPGAAMVVAIRVAVCFWKSSCCRE
jgi:hypothetical protein